MKYALNLAEDGRVLSAGIYPLGAPAGAILVATLPEGNLPDYIYQNGEFVHDPLPVEEVEEKPSQLDRIEAQVTYTAMMTDTLLEE